MSRAHDALHQCLLSLARFEPESELERQTIVAALASLEGLQRKHLIASEGVRPPEDHGQFQAVQVILPPGVKALIEEYGASVPDLDGAAAQEVIAFMLARFLAERGMLDQD